MDVQQLRPGTEVRVIRGRHSGRAGYVRTHEGGGYTVRLYGNTKTIWVDAQSISLLEAKRMEINGPWVCK